MSDFFSTRDKNKGEQKSSSTPTFNDPRAQGLIDSVSKNTQQGYSPSAQTNYLQGLGTNQLVSGLNTPAAQVDANGQMDAIRKASAAQTPIDVANVRSQMYNRPTGRNDIAVADTVSRNNALRDAALYNTQMGAQQFNANAQNQQNQQNNQLGQILANYLDPNHQQQTSTNQANNQSALQLLQLLRGEDTVGAGSSIGQSRKAGSDIAGSFIGSIGAAMMCWVARAVYGSGNPTWLVFRDWMEKDAPKWLLSLYLNHGEEFAEKVKKDEVLKKRVKKKMDEVLLHRFKIIRN